LTWTSFAFAARPDQHVVAAFFVVDQPGIQRAWERWVVEGDREILALRVLCGLFPCGTDLVGAGEDPEIRCVLFGFVVRNEFDFDVHGQGAYCAGVAVVLLGESADGGHDVFLSRLRSRLSRPVGIRSGGDRAGRIGTNAAQRSTCKRKNLWARKATPGKIFSVEGCGNEREAQPCRHQDYPTVQAAQA
jgi:hypothetical protein